MNAAHRTGSDPRAAVREKLIVALDVPGREEALALDDALGADLRWVKVGLELFTAAGPQIVGDLRERGRQVFLDLKLHDIPNTVAGAVRAAARHGADLLTLHAPGGEAMMEAAVTVRNQTRSSLRLLAVTVLTSLDGSEFPEVHRSPDPGERVRIFAAAAARVGMDGVVCSPRELAILPPDLPQGFLRVTPGIRPAGASAQDQARVATPAASLAAGATHLVVGRAITGAPDPAAALVAVLAEMAAVS
jgi:orotidine-5'-phosphate decarboxylase